MINHKPMTDLKYTKIRYGVDRQMFDEFLGTTPLPSYQGGVLLSNTVWYVHSYLTNTEYKRKGLENVDAIV